MSISIGRISTILLEDGTRQQPDTAATIEAGPAPWRLCIAPMMAWTDRHCRYFHRLLAPHARLYTEMVHSGAILFGDVERHLDFSP
jgi:tRNA-dihydrouridine synthase A